MDLERIKQNLRLRSGRSKKTRKQTVVQSNGSAHTIQPDQRNIPNRGVPEPARSTTQLTSGPEKPSIPNSNPKAEFAPLPSIDTPNMPKHRPSLPHASTGSDLKPSVKTQPARFGRSGVERPGKHPAKVPVFLRTVSESDTGAVLNDDDSSSALDFDLRPPPPRPKPPSVESLSESLFSSGHLNVLLRDPHYLARFTSFLTKYRPQYHPVLLRYLETQKAIKAVEYANAIAEGVPLSSIDNDGEQSIPRASVAARLDKAFEESSIAAFRLMVDSALPMYVTYNLVKLVTECLINEITGRQTALMTDLVGGLSEVFCLSDPKQEDNPIIYASEEFYRYTGYGLDDVIGRNCRFLQGSKTKKESVTRLRDSIGKGEGICETLLNYRRDGRPFINLLMIAPLHDDKGNVKYHIGAQVDVTGLVERGKGLDGFERYLISREMERREKDVRGSRIKGDEGFRKPRALAKLRDLSEMFDLEESAVVRDHSRSSSVSKEDDERSVGSSRKGGRRVLGDNSDTSSENDGEVAEDEDKTWKLGQSGRSGLSGKLPGVYDTYLLIRPAPSLRIIFVAPKLRRRLGNVVQHPFLSHVAASTSTLSGLKESFGSGVPVSAKINFLLEAVERRDGTAMRTRGRLEDVGRGRVCWISATPMLGSDDKVGVWMIVVVEKAKVPTKTKIDTLVRSEGNQVPQQSRSSQARLTQTTARASSEQQLRTASTSPWKQKHELLDTPIKPRRLEDALEPMHEAQLHVQSVGEGHIGQQNGVSVNQDHQKVSIEYKAQIEQEDEVETSSTAPENTRSSQPEPLDDAGDDFESRRKQLSDSERSNRAHDKGDSNGEADKRSATAISNAPARTTPGSYPPKARVMLPSLEADGFQDELNAFHSSSDDEDTVINHRNEEFSNNTPSPSRLGASGMDSASGRSKSYMDYLRHPSSRPSSEYNRAVSGSFLSKYNSMDGDQNDGDDFEDSECARSPYSVD